MSLCFRSLPARLSSFVSSQKPLSKIDRLQKHVSSSTFLKQFWETKRTLSIRAITENKPLPFIDYTLYPNLSPASLDIFKWNERQVLYNGNKSMAMYWAESSRKQHNRLQKLAFSKNRKTYSAPIRITSDNVTVFRTQNTEDIKNTMSLDNCRIISSRSLYTNRKSSSDGILFISNNTSNNSILRTNSQSPLPQDEDKPSQEKLQHIVDCLSQDLPNLFVKPQNYTIYTQNIIFINNIKGMTTVGVGNYAKQIILLRMIGHLKFAHVKLDVIKITMHPEDSTVKVRWRIRGVTGLKMFFSFWKYKVWKIQEAIDKDQELWYDGFSTYYVNGNGKIHKHVADKMMPDQDVNAKKDDLRIAAKLALITGLASIFNDELDSAL